MTEHLQTFLGLRFDQEWQDIDIWERFFANNYIQTMIEIGTGNGGMTLYFALQCYQRHINFHTFDNQDWINYNDGLPAALQLRRCFHHIDIFTDSHEVIYLLENARRPLAIFFDDGDKPKEWELFTPFTSPGDFCIVHDWGTEFHEKDIGKTNVERILAEESDLRPVGGWHAMWFRRV
jgi:cephalosporin hydroxylase